MRSEKAQKLWEWRERQRAAGTLPKYKAGLSAGEKIRNKEIYKEKMKTWRASPEGQTALQKMADSKRKFKDKKEYQTYWSKETRRRCAVNLEDCLRDKLSQAKKRAKKKGIEFSITLADVLNVYTDTCPYLGVKLTLCNAKNPQYSITIDRIDNSRGYVVGNIQILSHRANSLKNNVPIEELGLFLQNMEPRHKRQKRLVQPEEAILVEEKK